MGDPVCLVQWLVPEEDDREAVDAWKRLAEQINITFHDLHSKGAVEGVIRTWLEDNENSLFLYLGTHGIVESEDGPFIGIGKDGSDVMTWAELATLLSGASIKPVLWLGACGSSAVVEAWNSSGVSPLVAWIVAFDEPISPESCKAMLDKCIENTSVDSIVYADQELPSLRKALPGVSVNLFYPATLADGSVRYVAADEFPNRLGCTLKDYLIRAAR